MAAGRLDFRILGPLTLRVDGTPVPIGGPKQRALLALLLLSANRVVPRDRLLAELFGEQSPNSADHALRNHVSRLRKALGQVTGGEPRLAARPPGYLLRVEPGELDLETFERLATEGREALAAGDPAAAGRALRAAESLWQGRPLADLEFEPFARIEVERLEELRLAAVEQRIDAELLLGRHLALVAELEAASEGHPLRERFRAQLMLALYRCGRQAESLEVYRRTRRLLNDELGLEPGVELQELERGILLQDPALGAPPRGGEHAPWPPGDRTVCPFKGPAPFDAEDAWFFFGRERLVDELLGRLAGATCIAIVGASGSGKSSLLRAGLLPSLAERGDVHGSPLLLRPGEQPADALSRAAGGDLLEAVGGVPRGRRLVVAVDQLEELFAPAVDEAERRAFVDSLVDAAWDPDRRALVVVALRADFFGRLAQFPELADLVSASHVLLGPMTPSELRRVVEGPAERGGLVVEPALVDALVDETAGVPGGLPLLSTVLLDLWTDRDGEALTLEDYARLGGVRGALARHAEASLRALGEDDRAIVRRMALQLVADGEPRTRRRVTLAGLGAADDPDVARVVSNLVERRLLVVDDAGVELAHDALLADWPTLVRWLEDDTESRRVRQRLADAAAEWDAGGRGGDGLLRGARLTAALDWAETPAAAGLSSSEREFLAESGLAATRESERQRRAIHRLRATVALAALLLVGAVAGALVALHERGTARARTSAAVAERLGAQALVEPRIDRSLLLARAGIALDDSPTTRSNLLAALLRSPAAIGVVHSTGNRVLDEALSPDGRILAVGGDDGGVLFFDTRTFRSTGRWIAGSTQLAMMGSFSPLHALAFSPDGRTLVIGSTSGVSAEILLLSARTYTTRAAEQSRDLVAADLAFAPDGRTFVTGEGVESRTGAPLVVVRRRTTDGSELAASRPIPDGRLAGFVSGGRLVLVTEGDARSQLLDARTLRVARVLPEGGVAAVAARAEVAAFAGGRGVTLLDLRTGTRRAFTGRAPQPVQAIAMSRDGRVVATASADGTIEIWDASTASLRETFAGPAGVGGLQFSPAGSTLYSGAGDGTVTAWDVRGEARLGRPFTFSPMPAAGAGPARAKDATRALAVSPAGSLFASSPGPGRVTLWRAGTLSVAGTLHPPFGTVFALGFSRDGRFLAGSGDGHKAVVWDVRTRRIVRVLHVDSGTVAVAVSPSGDLVATGDIGGALRIYDLRSGKAVVTEQLQGSLQDVAFSPDGRSVAGATLSGAIVVLDVARRTVQTTAASLTAVYSLDFSPNSRTIAAAGESGDVDFWDARTGKQLPGTLQAQSGSVASVAFDPAGGRLLTTGSDGVSRLWDLATAAVIGAPLPGPAGGGQSRFFPDGKHAVAAFGNGSGVVWDVDPADWASRACHVAGRNLTAAEWQTYLPGIPYRRVCR